MAGPPPAIRHLFVPASSHDSVWLRQASGALLENEPRSGDICVSRGRKPAVKWEIRPSPVGTTEVATPPVKPYPFKAFCPQLPKQMNNLGSRMRPGVRYTLIIMTSVDFTSAAALSPRLRRISRAASAVMMEVMCCPPIESFTCASSPSMRTSTMRPTN
jgi:hypothetical protein